MLAVVVVIAVLALVAYWASRPQRVAAFVVARAASALGLEISAAGVSEYSLRGAPRLVLRDVVAREPGAATPLLRVARIDIALPWSTLRSGGSDLRIERIELDAPALDVPALQHWLAGRPPSEQRRPTLTRGLRVRDGSVANDGWRIDGIAIDLPELREGRPLRARVRGRYANPPMGVPFDLAIALSRPDAITGAALVGRIAIEQDDWRMPARVHLSGPMRIGDDGLRIAPARLAVSARWHSGETDLPFALGVHGPVHVGAGISSIAPAGIALRGDGLVPDIEARGALALGHRLVLQLHGRIAEWPEAWPALPPPLGESRTPLPFALDYAGQPAFDDVAHLQLQKDDARFDARFRLPDVLAWTTAASDASPLPPLQGRFSAARLEVAGATLEGIELRIDDTSAEPAAP